jgi:hypothetical protein
MASLPPFSPLLFRDTEWSGDGGDTEGPLANFPRGALVMLPSLPASVSPWSDGTAIPASSASFVLKWAFWGAKNKQMDVTPTLLRRIYQPPYSTRVVVPHAIVANVSTLQCDPLLVVPTGLNSVPATTRAATLTVRFNNGSQHYVYRVAQNASFVVT